MAKLQRARFGREGWSAPYLGSAGQRAGSASGPVDAGKRPCDGRVRLDYLVTWQSDTDSGGLFYVRVPRDLLDAKGCLTIEVRSLGSGSKRWFALDDVKTARQTERLILDALKPDGD